jgi:hypothetical protein
VGVTGKRPAVEHERPARRAPLQGGRPGGLRGRGKVARGGGAAAGGEQDRERGETGAHPGNVGSDALRSGDIVWVAGALALAVVAAGPALEAGGVELGTPLPPFLFGWHPGAALGWTALAVAVFGMVLAGVPRLLRASPPAFAVGSYVVALVLRLACAAAREGPGAWTRVFDPGRSFEAKNEYLPALAALRHGVGVFLDRFAEVVPALPVHAAGHPPGLLLTIDALGITSPAGLAALCLLGGAAVTPLTWLLGRGLLSEQRGRIAALLVAASPAMLVFGATSADALYATLGVLAALLLLRTRVAGGAALAAASLFAWSLLAVGAWAAIVRWRRDGQRAAAALAIACAVALVAFCAALAAATGYDHLGALSSTARVYDHSVARLRPYAYWVLGSPVAFGVMLGLPVAAWALRARGPVAQATALVIVVSALGGFTKAETERIWLFLVPFACLAAAAVLPRARLVTVLAALLAQALVVELLFGTVW